VSSWRRSKFGSFGEPFQGVIASVWQKQAGEYFAKYKRPSLFRHTVSPEQNKYWRYWTDIGSTELGPCMNSLEADDKYF
jgi:hypothetical protein